MQPSQPMHPVPTEQTVKTAPLEQPSGTTQPEMDASGQPMWYTWRGKLHVGTIDVGVTTLHSEYMDCIPALGGILKMTRIAKYEDLWTKILQTKPCSLSQRNATSIRGKTVAVHRLQSSSTLFHQLVQELIQTSKPQLLACHLLNEEHHFEVVLVPHCPELEECGLLGHVYQKPYMLHVLFVCQRSASHLPSSHQTLDAVDQSQVNGPSIPNKKTKGQRLVTGLQFCKKNKDRKVKKSDCQVFSSQNITNITASTDQLPNERSFLNTPRAPPPAKDTNVEVIDFYDGRCSSENTKNNAVNLSTETKYLYESGYKDMQNLERDNSWVINSEMQKVTGTAREQLLRNPVQEVEVKNMENNDNEKRGMDYTAKALKVISSENDLGQLPDVEENVTSDIYQHECQKRMNSSKNITKEKEIRTKRSKISTKWSINKFTKTYKPAATLTNTVSKMESRYLSSDHSKCSDSHFHQIADLDSILLKDEKFEKKVCEVVNKLSPSLLCEAEKKMGMQSKPQETQMENRNLLDTQKLRSLFSLKDSGKPDLIKPSMLKRNSQENIIVTPSHMDDRHQTYIRPDHNESLEICNRKKSKTNQDKTEHCNASSCHQMKDSTRIQDLPVNSTKRQKTAAKGGSLILRSGNNKCDKAVSSEEVSGKVKNPISMKSKSISDCLPRKCITTMCTTDLDFCSNTDQSQELDEDRHSPTKQTIKKKKKMPCSNRGPEMLLYSTPVTESSEHKVMHTSYNLMEHSHENNLKVDKRYNKRKIHKRKLECEWAEAVDHLHPKKKKSQILANSSKKCVIDSEWEVKKTPVTDNESSSLPLSQRNLQEKVKCDNATQNSGVQNSDCIEQQNKSKQQQEINEVKDTNVLKHSNISHPKPSEISKTFESVEKIQAENCQEIHDQSKNVQHHNHDSLLHKIVSSRIENLHETMTLDYVENKYTEKAKMCKPDEGGKLRGICGAVSSSQLESPSSPQSQLSNSLDTAVALSFLPKEMTHDCSSEITEAASSPMHGLCSGSKSFTGILYNNGFLVKHSKAIITENNSFNLQCESHHYMNKCDEIEKGQKPTTNHVTTPKLYASDKPFLINNNCSNVQDNISQSKEVCFSKNDDKSISVSSLQKQLKDDLMSAEESKYKKEIHPTNPALPEMRITSLTASPCPKVLAKRMISNIKYCMLKINSSSGSGLLDFNKKYEYLPILQASVETFFISQNNPKQSKQSGTQKSLFSEIISHGYEKKVLEKILTKMRLQLIINANLVNYVGQYPMSSSMETFALFIDGQVASASQGTDLPEDLHNTGASVVGNGLSPQCVKLPIAQQVSELNCPYKTSKMRTFYGTSCKIMVSSGIYNHSPADQGVPMSSFPEDCSSPLEAGQQHCFPVSLKKDLIRENISSTSFSSSIREDHINKIPKTTDRTMFVPNEFYQPCWEDFPYQHLLDGYQKSKFIHIFQGKQQDVIKLKCLLVTRKESYATLSDIELCGGHVLVHFTKLDQLLAFPQLPKLCASPSIRFGVYGSLSDVLEGKVRVVLTDMRMLLLLHHAALLDPNTGDVLQAVIRSARHHIALVPANTIQMCASLLLQRSRTPAEEKYRQVLKQNLTLVMKCVEAGAGHILGGSQESVCANLSPASPPSEYLTCLRFVHRCLNFAHRYTVVLIGEGLEETSSHQLSLYRLSAAREVLQDLSVEAPYARN